MNNRKSHRVPLLLLLALSLALVSGCAGAPPPPTQAASGMTLTLYKDPSCGCCNQYVQYLGEQGFHVQVEVEDNMTAIKQRFGVPDAMQSCHTMQVGDYFVEGHVPAKAIQKLLDERPDIAGIALPGEPDGAPGEPGNRTGTLTVYAVHHDGTETPFMTF